MPKIIPNIREQLLNEAKRQIAQKGYGDTTMRSVAGACGFAVGTMYNYFESKEMLVATFVYEDWQRRLDNIAAISDECPRTLFEVIYNSLVAFVNDNKKLFTDPDAARILRPSFATKHRMLRNQLAEFIIPVCQARELEQPEIVAGFVAEAIISVAIDGVDFDIVYPVIEKIIT